MPLPGYQEFMLPLLRLSADRQVHALRDARDKVANQMQLTETDRQEMLPSGLETKFINRFQWASTYLFKAGLFERPSRGKFRVTERGLAVLAENPASIDNRYLKDRFPAFVEFVQGKPSDNNGLDDREPDVTPADETPEEILETAYSSLRKALASELLERIRNASPAFFEGLVIDVLVQMGYGGSRADAGQAVGRSGDGGIDGIIKEDKLGLDAIYVQAKRWEAAVGRPIVQAFAGSLEGHRAKKGVLITTSRFSSDATDYVNRIEKRIVLLNGEQLAELMIDHGVGVTTAKEFKVQKIDGDYFEEE